MIVHVLKSIYDDDTILSTSKTKVPKLYDLFWIYYFKIKRKCERQKGEQLPK